MGQEILVASTNPVKVEAVEEVVAMYDFLKGARVVPCSVATGVSDQPLTLEETTRGARNRAENAYETGALSIGIEGGLIEVIGSATGYLVVTACSVFDGRDHRIGLSCGFELPHNITHYMLHENQNLSQAAYDCGMTNNPNFGCAEGAIGVVSKGRITRKGSTVQALMMAFVSLENPALYQGKPTQVSTIMAV